MHNLSPTKMPQPIQWAAGVGMRCSIPFTEMCVKALSELQSQQVKQPVKPAHSRDPQGAGGSDPQVERASPRPDHHHVHASEPPGSKPPKAQDKQLPVSSAQAQC